MIRNQVQRFVWAVILLACGACVGVSSTEAAGEPAVSGWLHWRGPQQNGTSMETNLPNVWERGGTADLWSIELAGRGTPVIAGDRIFAWGYRGEGGELHEVLAALDAGTGRVQWEKRYNDYLSDVIYDRYAIGAPTVDPQTGNVYLMTTPGDLLCYSPAGKLLWERAAMEELGMLTFPNGRTGAVSIDGDLAIIHVISSNWGAEGPPRDRFYAFDKRTGDLVWSSDPGVGPPYLKDSSFASPVFAWHNGTRVFYCVTGDGNIVCINARTGKQVWRYQLAIGGINSSPLLHGEKLIVTHGVENVDSSRMGGMIALNINAVGEKDESGKMVLGKDAVLWRNEDIVMFTSSPVLAGKRVYQVDQTGVLYCVDADTGATLWTKKLGADQIHASPLWADGKLYVPMNQGLFYILKPTDSGVEQLSKVQLEGNCLGAPAAWNGRVYVFTTKRLYCFGHEGGNQSGLPQFKAPPAAPKPGKPVALQIIPVEVLLKPGQEATVRARSIDDVGLVVHENVDGVKYEKFIPPTAKVKAELDAAFTASTLTAGPDAAISAGAFKGTAGELGGTLRGRVLPDLPYHEDFEDYKLVVDHETEAVKFAYPPLPWIGARFKWEVRDLEGGKVLAKTTDRLILQRAITFIGDPDESNYTIQADVRSDGNRRGMGEVGLIVQRYIVLLKGNHRQLEVSSNQERLKESVPFAMKPGEWYTIKATVVSDSDGGGVIRAKAWPRDEAEPEAWTIEVNHAHAHKKGSPGVFGFSPQEKFRVYVDNIRIEPND